MKHLTAILLIFALLLGMGATGLAADNRFGWKGDSGNKKATPFKLHPGYKDMVIAPKSDLSKKTPVIWNQLDIGSCVGHGVGRAMEYTTNVSGGGFFDPSRLFIYFGARELENSIEFDEGCQIVDAVKFVIKRGAPPQKLWPYDTKKFAERPPAAAYKAAEQRQALNAYKVDNTDGKSIRLALSNGFPVVFGSLVYSGIDRITSSAPVLEMPKRGERPSGGHCMVIVGHDDEKKLYLVENSWGDDWGVKGRFWIPYAYIHNGRLTEDCWVIDRVELPKAPKPPRRCPLLALFARAS